MLNIVQLHWERANLHLTVDCEINGDVFLVKEDRKLLLRTEGRKIVLPVYNLPQGRSLSAGKWHFLFNGDVITVSKELISDFENFSRNFFYKNEKYALLIDFSTDKDLSFYLHSRYMMINRRPEKFFRLAEEQNFKGKLKIVFTAFGLKAANCYYKLLRPFRKKNNVLFFTENGNEIGGNLKALYEQIDFEKYNVKVFAQDALGSPKKVSDKLLKKVTLLGICRVIFIDNYCPLLTNIDLDRNVKLVQLWHAGLGFKSVGYARFGMPGSPHPFRSCHRKYTEVFVDCEKLIDVYKEVFGCKREVFRACGMPRLDGYSDSGRISAVAESIYSKNPLIKSEKTILFAPTFRGQSHKDAHYDFSVIDFNALSEFLEQNGFIMLLKLHPFIGNKPEIPENCRNRIFDYSDCEINDLIYVSDIMITDYSSCAYEFSLFDRPLVFFRPDKTLYEYEHKVYTLDIFSKKQYEAQTFNELLKVLEELKGDLPKERLLAVHGTGRKDVCKAVLAEVFGE